MNRTLNSYLPNVNSYLPNLNNFNINPDLQKKNKIFCKSQLFDK